MSTFKTILYRLSEFSVLMLVNYLFTSLYIYVCQVLKDREIWNYTTNPASYSIVIAGVVMVVICWLLGWYWDDYIWKPLTNKIIQLKDRIFKNA